MFLVGKRTVLKSTIGQIRRTDEAKRKVYKPNGSKFLADFYSFRKRPFKSIHKEKLYHKYLKEMFHT